MRTSDPVQGFLLAGNHYLIHLTLLLAEPICMAYWDSHHCDGKTFDDNHVHRLLESEAATEAISDENYLLTLSSTEKYSWLNVHLYCFLATVLSEGLNSCDLIELGRFFEILKVPFYIYQIFYAHYYLLNHSVQASGFGIECQTGFFDLTKVWMTIEVQVFYCYIGSAMLFVLVAQIFKVNKRYVGKVTINH